MYFYDAAGRLKYVKETQDVVEFSYDTNGNLVEKKSENLIVNGDFELYSRNNGLADGWGNWESAGATAQYQIEETDVIAGARAQKMSSSQLNGGLLPY